MPSSIVDRFTGPDGRRRLVESIRTQRIVGNLEEIAEKIVSAGTIEIFHSGDALIEQNDGTNDIYFLVAGSVSIQINRRDVITRSPGQHVGEMAAIDVHALRSASVIATVDTVAIKVAEPDFSKIANEHPTIWRQLATELGDRLRQRGAKRPSTKRYTKAIYWFIQRGASGRSMYTKRTETRPHVGQSLDRRRFSSIEYHGRRFAE